MSEHEKDLAFLRQCISYDDRAERRRLEERITKAQREERCVRRLIWLMGLFLALSGAGLAYGAALQENFPDGQFRLVINIISTIGLASLISLMGFVGLLVPYRKELNGLREQCRRLSAELLESRLAKPRARPSTEVPKEQELFVNHQLTLIKSKTERKTNMRTKHSGIKLVRLSRAQRQRMDASQKAARPSAAKHLSTIAEHRG